MKKVTELSVAELNRIKRIAIIALLSWMVGAPALLLLLGSWRFVRVAITVWWCIAAAAMLLYVCLFFYRFFSGRR
jgi:type II secretory pathway component PulL